MECLEARCLLTAPVIETISPQTVFGGKSIIIPVRASHEGADADDPITYSVTSNNSQITAQVLQGSFLQLDIEIPSAVPGAPPTATGSLLFLLFGRDSVENTVRTISGLVKSGFFEDVIFHRITTTAGGSNLAVIQGGDPDGNGMGGPPRRVPGEDEQQLLERRRQFQFPDEFDLDFIFTGFGQLAMAKSTDDTNSSQFFITLNQPRHLDFNHTIFGQLVRGEAFLRQLGALPTDANSRPNTPPRITGARIVENLNDTVLLIKAAPGTNAGDATITVRATAADGDAATQTFRVTAMADAAANNAPPIIVNQIGDQVTAVDTPVSFTVTGRDLENDAITVAAQIVSGNGTFAIDGNTVTVTPAAGFTGQITIQVGVTDTAHPTLATGDTQTINIAVGGTAIDAELPVVPRRGTEGSPRNNEVVATFTAADSDVASDFTAFISWGDGNVTQGIVTENADGSFTVTGTNTYRQAGVYRQRVTVTRNTFGNRAVLTSDVVVADAMLTTIALMPVISNLFNQTNLTNVVVATFTDANVNGRVGDYTAMIEWGDGTTTPGTIVAAANGQFNVTGSHNYAQGGLYFARTTLLSVNPADDEALVAIPGALATTPIGVAGPVPTNESYVAQLYFRFLNRVGDAEGMVRLSHLLNRGVLTRDQAVAFIVTSEEYRTLQINELYREVLNRRADRSGLAAMLEYLKAGGTIENVRRFLLESEEFFEGLGGGTDNGFVDALYTEVLGRTADTTGRDNFRQALSEGVPRSEVIRILVNSEEFHRRRTSDLFDSLLGRRPAAAATDEYFRAFQAGVTDDAIQIVIGTSPEFANRLLN